MYKSAFLVVSLVAAPVFAQAPEATTPSFTVEGAKVTSAIQDKEAADEKSTFATGERAWLWLKLKPEADGAMLKLRWSLNGEAVWTMDPTAVRLGRTWYYKTLDVPGDWKVEVLDGNDKLLHTATLTVTGEPMARPAGGETAVAAAAPLADVSESTHVSVVDLKLTEEVQNREPVSPATSFAAGDKVYAWLKLMVKEPETSIKVNWYLGDAVVHSSEPVTVKESSGWRTWLYKTVDKAGAWKVEVVDTEGKVVHRTDFTVQ